MSGIFSSFSQRIALSRMSRQTLALSCISLLDLVSTIWVLQTQDAAEANPLMNFFLAQGLGIFVIAKLAFVLFPLIVLEWARRLRPRFVQRAGSIAIAAYLGLYCAGVARINLDLPEQEIASPPIFQTILLNARKSRPLAPVTVAKPVVMQENI